MDLKECKNIQVALPAEFTQFYRKLHLSFQTFLVWFWETGVLVSIVVVLYSSTDGFKMLLLFQVILKVDTDSVFPSTLGHSKCFLSRFRHPRDVSEITGLPWSFLEVNPRFLDETLWNQTGNCCCHQCKTRVKNCFWIFDIQITTHSRDFIFWKYNTPNHPVSMIQLSCNFFVSCCFCFIHILVAIQNTYKVGESAWRSINFFTLIG